MIAAIYGPKASSAPGSSSGGLTVLYNQPGIILAMLFVTMPFTIRSLQPVLMGLERDQEEAAFTLGASPWITFWKVTVPSVLPGLLTGVFLTFVRALGEFGSIVIVAGNIPMKTQVASVYVYGEIEATTPGGDIRLGVDSAHFICGAAAVGATDPASRVNGYQNCFAGRAGMKNNHDAAVPTAAH